MSRGSSAEGRWLLVLVALLCAWHEGSLLSVLVDLAVYFLLPLAVLLAMMLGAGVLGSAFMATLRTVRRHLLVRRLRRLPYPDAEAQPAVPGSSEWATPSRCWRCGGYRVAGPGRCASCSDTRGPALIGRTMRV